MSQVEIKSSTTYTISFGDNAAIQIPPALLVEYDDRTFLKIKATARIIVQLVCGKHEKNASLSGSTALEELITKRNHTWENHSLQATQDSQFFGEGKPEASGREAKKQKLQSNGLVAVHVNGQQVECLMLGQRPSRCDLMVPLDELQLSAVFAHLATTPQEDLSSERWRKRSQQEEEEETK